MLQELVLFVIILAAAALLMYLDYTKPRSKEHFVGTPTSYGLYKQYASMDYDKQMNIYKDTLGDINNLLLMYGCGINIGPSPRALDVLVRTSAKGLHVVPFDIYTASMSDVYTKLYSMIHEFYDKIGRTTINGQVYVVLSQSPYYRDNNDNPIAVQFSYNNYNNMPLNVMKQGVNELYPPIQFYGYMIFTAYDEDAEIINNMETRKQGVLNIKKNFRQKESICYMACPQQDLPCGCSSQDAPYLSNCLESENPGKMSSGERYSYAILYRVSPRFSDMMGRDILQADYSDYEWSPETINPIPTKEDPNLPEPVPLASENILGDGIILFQNCNYKGWRSKLIPYGKYNLPSLRNRFKVVGDASSYKAYGDVKVKLYKSRDWRKPVASTREDGYIVGDVPCLTKYIRLNDALESIEITSYSS